MKNPYKELLPYIESDAHSFKGRTSEIEEMYESFDRNEYLVCHADSGEGKSSIIEAGLIPKMKANCYFPVRIIFKSDDQFKKNDIDFDNVICGIIENEIKKLRSNNSISVNVVYPRRLTNSDDFELTNWEKELVDSYAWLKLRYERVTIDNLLYTPVLIFDQFEEVFTNPLSQEWTDSFFKWLQEISTDLCPQRIINELEKHIGNDDFPEINTQKQFKAIFSLRSEYVGKLDYWGIQRHYIPLLKNNRYLLRPLTIKGAKEVITQQDDYDGLNAVADEIIDVLRKQQKGKNYVSNDNSELPCIPALFLSVICSRAFSMSKEERIAFMQRIVAEKDEDKETAINSLIESFYEKAVADCEIPLKDMGVVEDVLVNNEGSRQRVSSHTDALKAIDFSTKYMEKLKDARLIRVIPEYNRDDDSVEFVHDALCPVIVKRKEFRHEFEAKKREEERLKEQARKMRKHMMLTAAIALTIMGILLFLLWQNNRIIEEQNARIFSETEKDSIALLNNSLSEQIRINEIQKDSLNNQLYVNEKQRDSLIRFLYINQKQKIELQRSLQVQQKQAVLLNKKNDELVKQLATIKAQETSIRNKDYELKLLSQFDSLLNLKQYEKALETYERLKEFKETTHIEISVSDLYKVINLFKYWGRDTLVASAKRLECFHKADSLLEYASSVSPININVFNIERLNIALWASAIKTGEFDIKHNNIKVACERLIHDILKISDSERDDNDIYYLMMAYYYLMYHYLFLDDFDKTYNYSKLIISMDIPNGISDLKRNACVSYYSKALEINVYAKKKKHKK